MDGWMGGWMGGWMDGRTDGWMDDGWMDTRYKNLYLTSDTFKQITIAIKAIFRQTYYKANIKQV